MVSMHFLASPPKSWPVSNLPRLTGISLLEKPAHKGMSGSDAMALSIVHFTVARWRVVPGPTTALALTRGSSKEEMRMGAKPPISVQRVMISFEQAHCMKIQAASGFFEYFDSARIEPP